LFTGAARIWQRPRTCTKIKRRKSGPESCSGDNGTRAGDDQQLGWHAIDVGTQSALEVVVYEDG
jgi:hypothetical protein